MPLNQQYDPDENIYLQKYIPKIELRFFLFFFSSLTIYVALTKPQAYHKRQEKKRWFVTNTMVIKEYRKHMIMKDTHQMGRLCINNLDKSILVER